MSYLHAAIQARIDAAQATFGAFTSCDECRLDSLDYFQVEGAKARERLEVGIG